MNEIDRLRAECDALKHDIARHVEIASREAEARIAAEQECDALRVALRGVIAEADRNTDAFIGARALLIAPRKEGERG